MRRVAAVVVVVVLLVFSLPAAASGANAPSVWKVWFGWWAQTVGSLIGTWGSPVADGSRSVTAAETVDPEPPPPPADSGPVQLLDATGDGECNGGESYPEWDPNG